MSNNNLVSRIKSIFLKNKKLNQEDLNKVNGAGEPEEFDWKPKEYETPVKEGPKEGEWVFGPVDPNKKTENK